MVLPIRETPVLPLTGVSLILLKWRPAPAHTEKPPCSASRSTMFDALHRLLTGVDPAHQAAAENDSAFALAVLLIEVARSSDNRVEDREEGVIERALAKRFGLDQAEVVRLVKAAEEGALQATDL